jgi:hypothetical protein
MAIEALIDLDLRYTPCFGSSWDAVRAAFRAWAGFSRP